eukprot:10768842-Alexandrium_andersonii.AAC.1
MGVVSNISLTAGRGINLTPTLRRTYNELCHVAQATLQLERVIAIKAGRGCTSISATNGHDYGLLVWWEGPAGPLQFVELSAGQNERGKTCIGQYPLRLNHPDTWQSVRLVLFIMGSVPDFEVEDRGPEAEDLP